MAYKRYSIFGKEAGWSKSVIRNSELQYNNFRDEDVRNELALKTELKYSKRSLDSRVGNRRNITYDMRKYMSALVAIFIEYCPYKTGNGRLNGIKYDIKMKGSGEIQLGGLLAPYIVHLGFPLSHSNIHANWIYNSIEKCNLLIEAEGWPIDFHLSEIGYGWCKFSVMNLGGEEYD